MAKRQDLCHQIPNVWSLVSLSEMWHWSSAFIPHIMIINSSRYHIPKQITSKMSCSIMLVWQCHKPSPSHHHYGWYVYGVYHSQSWVVPMALRYPVARLRSLACALIASRDGWWGTWCWGEILQKLYMALSMKDGRCWKMLEDVLTNNVDYCGSNDWNSTWLWGNMF